MSSSSWESLMTSLSHPSPNRTEACGRAEVSGRGGGRVGGGVHTCTSSNSGSVALCQGGTGVQEQPWLSRLAQAVGVEAGWPFSSSSLFGFCQWLWVVPPISPQSRSQVSNLDFKIYICSPQILHACPWVWCHLYFLMRRVAASYFWRLPFNLQTPYFWLTTFRDNGIVQISVSRTHKCWGITWGSRENAGSDAAALGGGFAFPPGPKCY